MRITTDARPSEPDRRRRPAGPGGQSQERRCRHRGQHGRLEIDRRRQDVAGVPRRAREATTTSACGSIRTIPTSILLAADQGAIVTVNGGKTWSSWYNQPTAQLYHVTADNAFPYRLCSGQQESGSACVASRGATGARSRCASGPGRRRRVRLRRAGPARSRHRLRRSRDRPASTGAQARCRTSRPMPGRAQRDFRTVRTAPVVFSPVDPHVLVLRGQHLWKTLNGGQTLEADQPRPDAQDVGRFPRASASTRITPAAQAARSAASSTRSRRRRSPPADLGRHRRRPRATDRRRRRCTGPT